MAGTTPIKPETAHIGLPTARGSTFAAMSVRHYPRLWTMGFLWNMTRWMSVFLCTYMTNQLSHSPLLVSGVGAAFFAPMFFGGALAGAISDRLDRRRTMLGLLLFLIPTAALMATVVITGAIRVWMIYPFMVAIGLSMVVDMTSRRALVYDLVGESFITNALALESLAMTCGSVLGSLSAGTVISLLGIGPAYLLIAVFYVISLVVLLGVPTPGARDRGTSNAGLFTDMKAAFHYLRRNRALVSILGVTVIMNFFYFSFTPLVPVFAENLGVNAFWTGILASASAFGSMIGTLLIARGLGMRRGRAYAGGSTLAMLFLLVFASASWYPLALLALIGAGVGMAGFSTMQSALVMTSAESEMRGRAMGLLSMGIGVLPFAMLLLGGVAQLVSPAAAVTASGLIGLALMGVWSLRRPEALRLV